MNFDTHSLILSGGYFCMSLLLLGMTTGSLAFCGLIVASILVVSAGFYFASQIKTLIEINTKKEGE